MEPVFKEKQFLFLSSKQSVHEKLKGDDYNQKGETEQSAFFHLKFCFLHLFDCQELMWQLNVKQIF